MSVHFVPKFLEHELGRTSLGQESFRNPLSEYSLSDSEVDGYEADDEDNEIGGIRFPEAIPERSKSALYGLKTLSDADKRCVVGPFCSLSGGEDGKVPGRDLDSGFTEERSSSVAKRILELEENRSPTPETLLPPKASLGKISWFPHQDPSGSLLLTQLKSGLKDSNRYREKDIYWSLESYRISRNNFRAQRLNSVSSHVMDEMTRVVEDFAGLPKDKQNLTLFHRSQLIDVLWVDSD